MSSLIVRGDTQHLPLLNDSVDAIVTDPPYMIGIAREYRRSFRTTHRLSFTRVALTVSGPFVIQRNAHMDKRVRKYRQINSLTRASDTRRRSRTLEAHQ